MVSYASLPWSVLEVGGAGLEGLGWVGLVWKV